MVTQKLRVIIKGLLNLYCYTHTVYALVLLLNDIAPKVVLYLCPKHTYKLSHSTSSIILVTESVVYTTYVIKGPR